MRKCNNSYNKDIDDCPVDVDAAYKSIYHHRLETIPAKNNRQKRSEGMAFTQAEWQSLVAGKDGKIIPKMKCYKCHKFGHPKERMSTARCRYSGRSSKIQTGGGGNPPGPSSPPSGGGNQGQPPGPDGAAGSGASTTSSITNTQGGNAGGEQEQDLPDMGVVCTLIQTKAMVKANEIAAVNSNFSTKMKALLLLDNQSTHHIFCNNKCVQRVKDSGDSLVLVSNGGQMTTRQKGWFGNERVWFNDNGVTNTLSFSQCKRSGYRIIHDNDLDQFVMSGKGIHMVFQATDEGSACA